MKYWLLKSEPSDYSIDDLQKEPNKTACWDGVRNYQARNFMREMKRGDKVLFYHSNAKPPCVVGVATVVKQAYPDHTQFDEDSKYFDPKSKPDEPRWSMVDIQHQQTFDQPLSLDRLRQAKPLAKMRPLARGNRLSVMPVTAAEFQHILKLAESAAG